MAFWVRTQQRAERDGGEMGVFEKIRFKKARKRSFLSGISRMEAISVSICSILSSGMFIAIL